MNWEEVRKIYPDRFVKIKILRTHIENNVRYIEDMSVVRAFEDERDATRELVRTKDDELVYHTGKEKLEVPIRRVFGYRGAV
jgi:hypothetical protein